MDGAASHVGNYLHGGDASFGVTHDLLPGYFNNKQMPCCRYHNRVHALDVMQSVHVVRPFAGRIPGSDHLTLKLAAACINTLQR